MYSNIMNPIFVHYEVHTLGLLKRYLLEMIVGYL